LWAITPSAVAETPELPTNAYKKTADADLKFLQDRLSTLAKKQAAGDKILDGQMKPALGVALMLSAYGDALGDPALKADAIKVAEAINKKEFKEAEGLAKKLTVKPGKAGKPGPLPKPFKDELMLAAVMNPFRGSTVGGLNIDREIKDMTKTMNPAKIDVPAVEILAVRSAVINAYGFHYPNQKATVNDANKKLWEKLSAESVDLSKQIVTEAGKGNKADEKKIRTLLTNLNARCTDCHNKFRDDE
jgi:cytochrome c556